MLIVVELWGDFPQIWQKGFFKDFKDLNQIAAFTLKPN